MRILRTIILSLAAVLPLIMASCSHSDPRTQALITLRDDVQDQLEALTPGDWIVIGPTAEMVQATKVPGKESLSVLATNVSTLRETLDLMESQGKLSPRIWVCRELEQPGSKKQTPGNARLRTHLKELLIGRTHFSVDERVITMQLKLLKAPRRVLFIHTDTHQPHSSVGIELDYAGNQPPTTSQPTSKPAYRHAELKP